MSRVPPGKSNVFSLQAAGNCLLHGETHLWYQRDCDGAQIPSQSFSLVRKHPPFICPFLVTGADVPNRHGAGLGTPTVWVRTCSS